MDARCNITKLVNNVISSLRFGLSCMDKSTDMVYQYYLNGLGCNPKEIICLPKDQTGGSTNVRVCRFYIQDIKFTDVIINNTPVGVIFEVDQFHNGTGDPSQYEYIWSYDGSIFNLVGNITSPTLTLEYINGMPPSPDVEAQVSVQCRDLAGCIFTEVCTYTMKTITQYQGNQYNSGIGCL